MTGRRRRTHLGTTRRPPADGSRDDTNTRSCPPYSGTRAHSFRSRLRIRQCLKQNTSMYHFFRPISENREIKKWKSSFAPPQKIIGMSTSFGKKFGTLKLDYNNFKTYGHCVSFLGKKVNFFFFFFCFPYFWVCSSGLLSALVKNTDLRRSACHVTG